METNKEKNTNFPHPSRLLENVNFTFFIARPFSYKRNNRFTLGACLLLLLYIDILCHWKLRDSHDSDFAVTIFSLFLSFVSLSHLIEIEWIRENRVQKSRDFSRLVELYFHLICFVNFEPLQWLSSNVVYNLFYIFNSIRLWCTCGVFDSFVSIRSKNYRRLHWHWARNELVQSSSHSWPKPSTMKMRCCSHWPNNWANSQVSARNYSIHLIY